MERTSNLFDPDHVSWQTGDPGAVVAVAPLRFITEARPADAHDPRSRLLRRDRASRSRRSRLIIAISILSCEVHPPVHLCPGGATCRARAGSLVNPSPAQDVPSRRHALAKPTPVAIAPNADRQCSWNRPARGAPHIGNQTPPGPATAKSRRVRHWQLHRFDSPWTGTCTDRTASRRRRSCCPGAWTPRRSPRVACGNALQKAEQAQERVLMALSHGGGLSRPNHLTGPPVRGGMWPPTGRQSVEQERTDSAGRCATSVARCRLPRRTSANGAADQAIAGTPEAGERRHGCTDRCHPPASHWRAQKPRTTAIRGKWAITGAVVHGAGRRQLRYLTDVTHEGDSGIVMPVFTDGRTCRRCQKH